MKTYSARDRLRLICGAGAGTLLSACGGGRPSAPVIAPASTMAEPSFTLPPVAAYVPQPIKPGQLYNQYRNHFRVGAASEIVKLPPGSITRKRMDTQFNSVTAEYSMKANIISPVEGSYDFSQADALLDYAEARGKTVRGHALLWHEATPAWMLTGNNAQIKAKLETYITAVMTHFKGRITDWDVVNEVITDDDYANGPYRNTQWLQTVGGPQYINWAFNAARAADPDARLFLNDYSTELPGKRARLITVMQNLIDAGVPVDGVGHQMHLRLTSSIPGALAAIDAVDGMFAGLVNQVTELDISIYTDPGTCWETQTNCIPDVGNPMPAAMARLQANMLLEFFQGLALRPSVDSVTFWGVDDGQSWLNYAPAERFNHPLLFDRNAQPKAAFQALTDPLYRP